MIKHMFFVIGSILCLIYLFQLSDKDSVMILWIAGVIVNILSIIFNIISLVVYLK